VFSSLVFGGWDNGHFTWVTKVGKKKVSGVGWKLDVEGDSDYCWYSRNREKTNETFFSIRYTLSRGIYIKGWNEADAADNKRKVDVQKCWYSRIP
jgi:hypothetical protein